MKKIYLLLTVVMCAFLFMVGGNIHAKTLIDDNIEKATYYNNISTRNCSDYVMEKVIDDHSIVVLGSSELSSFDNLAYPPELFNYGNSDFNMILMGGAYFQSLPQAVNVGALSNNIKNNKIVLILSPQWFSSEGLTSDFFCSRYEETNFVEFLKNDSISRETRNAVANRMNELLASDSTALSRAQKDEELYLYGSLNPLTHLEMKMYNSFKNAKAIFETAKDLKSIGSQATQANYINVENIKWDELIQEAEHLGAESCTSNAFGVYDDYYSTYIEENIDSMRDSYYSDDSFAESPEYDDFRLFLDVCNELDIEPLIVSVPVNGRWYDYCGFSKADRNTYYQRIRDICDEYNVSLADFSQKEYEIYFLRDIMHLGWKGWVYVDRAVYEFYNDRPITDVTTYKDLTPETTIVSEGVEVKNAGSYRFSSYGRDDTVTISLPHSQMELDRTSLEGYRTGTYLHTGESGVYTTRIALGDAYVDNSYFLEEGAVYKLEYDVTAIGIASAAIDNFAFSKISY